MIDKSIKKFDYKKYSPKTVIGEFSGRDSVAAIMKAFEKYDYILPIASFAGTEYGDYNTIYANYLKTKKIVNEKYKGKKTLYPLIEYNDFELWKVLNGRVMTLLIKKYDFFTPCIGCHLYFHLTKIPFAINLSKIILSGERESHDGKQKVNQLGKSLDIYQNVIEKSNCKLEMPIRNVYDGEIINDLIGYKWEEGKNHPSCVLSGNYRDINYKAIYDNKKLDKFLNEFLKPAGKLIVKYIENDKKDLKKLEKRILEII
ncbi:MAG: hypothetical protein ACQEQE_08655 [Bacillota bacterium]